MRAYLLLLWLPLGAVVPPGVALADPPPGDPVPVELCFQQPGAEEGRTIGHMRLVVGERYYERVTVRPGSGDPETDWMDDRERNRRCEAFLHALPPMLRFPLTDRTVWGERRRHALPQAATGEGDERHWPFECVALPLTEAQRAELVAVVDGPFPAGEDRVVDHDFQYLTDNCTTWICQSVAAAIRAAPGLGDGEDALVRLLDRRRNTPARLRPRLERWLAARAEESP